MKAQAQQPARVTSTWGDKSACTKGQSQSVHPRSAEEDSLPPLQAALGGEVLLFFFLHPPFFKGPFISFFLWKGELKKRYTESEHFCSTGPLP